VKINVFIMQRKKNDSMRFVVLLMGGMSVLFSLAGNWEFQYTRGISDT